jgi:hypothetical protein
MPYTARFSEQWELLASISPASYDAEQNTGYVCLANFYRAVAIIHCGVIGGDLNVDFEEGTTTAGANAQSFDTAGKDITKTATTDNNTISVIEIRPEEFDIADSYDCINLEITPASAGIFSAQIWGAPKFAPAATTNLDTVTD